MNEFDNLLEKLNDLKIIQKSIDWAECLPEEIWDKYFKDNFKPLKYGLNVQPHRWYETSIDVIEIYGRFLGIRYLSNSFSESQEIIDCYVQIEFFEMKEVNEITYKQIK